MSSDSDGMIPKVDLKFVDVFDEQYGFGLSDKYKSLGFVYRTDVFSSKIRDAETVLSWCHAQFDEPSFNRTETHGINGVFVNEKKYDRSGNWGYRLFYPNQNHICGYLYVVFHRKEQATLFEMIFR